MIPPPSVPPPPMQASSLALAYVYELFARLEASGTPHIAQREEPQVAKLLGAYSAFSVAADARFPLILAALPRLGPDQDLSVLAERMRAAAPKGVFGLWQIDDARNEALIISWGSAAQTQTIRSLRGPSHLHDAFTRALRSGKPMPVIGADLAEILEHSDASETFYRRIARDLRAIAAAWQSVTPLSDNERHELALLLIARLMFLHFVQDKGWLPSRTFIPALLTQEASSVYQRYLTPLFFDALNLPADARVSGVIPREVPYLNGGLFAQTPLERAHPTLDLPNALLRKVVTATFQPFHFTDSETNPTRDAVAPPMLGEVFERLMDPLERSTTGAFYTPKELCDWTVEGAIFRALQRRLSPALAQKLRAGERLDPADAERAASALLRLKILDPAVGTGAFLMSAGQRLEDIYLASIAPSLRAPMSRYALRSHWISHGLSGVDIQPTAVTLATLRLWLWLAAAQSEDEPVHSLPNLEHRIRCGNALNVGVGAANAECETSRQLAAASAHFSELRGEARYAQLQRIEALERALVQERLTDHLRELQEARSAQGELFTPRRAREFQEALSDVQTQLSQTSTMTRAGLFDPELHFADVMQEGGFDIVLGNPPWLALSRVEEPLRATLRARFGVLRPQGVKSASPDLSLAFLELSARLVAPDGVIAMVIPAKALRAAWGSAWRAWSARNFTHIEVRELGTDEPHGFRASVYPCVFIGERGEGSLDVGEVFSAIPSEESPLLNDRSRTVGQLYELRYGVKTGANDAYLGRDFGAPTVGAIRGRDIRPFTVRDEVPIVFPHRSDNGAPFDELEPVFSAWAHAHVATLRKRKNLRPSQPFWQLLCMRPSAVGWRVAWRDVARSLQAVVLPPLAMGGALALNSTYYAALASEDEAHLLCAWLNSAQASDFVRARAQRALNGHFRFDARAVGQLPVPAQLLDPAHSWRSQLVSLSHALHDEPQHPKHLPALEALTNELWATLHAEAT